MCLSIEGHERYHFSEFLVSKINYCLLTLLSLKSLAPPPSYLYPENLQECRCRSALRLLFLCHIQMMQTNMLRLLLKDCLRDNTVLLSLFYLGNQVKKEYKLWDEIFRTK